jgi:Flp pilus assembly protein TadG
MIAQKGKSYGQAMLEFVLVIPLLLGLLFVLFDLGRVTYYYSSINNAAREGARYGIVNKGDIVGTKAAAENAAVGIGGGSVVATPFFDAPDQTYVIVTVSLDFTPATPLVAALISGGGSTITLTSQARMFTE